MGLCKDKSTNYLKGLGYNVVRHPREGIGPLHLIGRQNGGSAWLGGLGQMLDQPPAPPPIEADLQAAAVNGQESSKLELGLGVNVLGGLLGAMGGDLGADTEYTDASTIAFLFQDVLSDRIEPLAVSNYLEGAKLRAENPLLREYVLGNGELFLITETIKSNRFTVKFERSRGVEAKVNVPVIQQAVGGKISVAASGAQGGTVSFEGERHLSFGFRCFALGVLDGELRLTISKAGALPLARVATPPAESFAILDGEGLLELAAEPA